MIGSSSNQIIKESRCHIQAHTDLAITATGLTQRCWPHTRKRVRVVRRRAARKRVPVTENTSLCGLSCCQGKPASPVRRGGVGKGLAQQGPRRRPTRRYVRFCEGPGVRFPRATRRPERVTSMMLLLPCGHWAPMARFRRARPLILRICCAWVGCPRVGSPTPDTPAAGDGAAPRETGRLAQRLEGLGAPGSGQVGPAPAGDRPVRRRRPAVTERGALDDAYRPRVNALL
jgi:hypothetical protein